MKFFGYRTLKTSIGATAAIMLANQMGLQYSVSAGIITILSVQSTKRQSVNIAMQRLGACVLALAISSVLFGVLGYHAVIFGLFLLLFIPMAAKLKVAEGIVVSSVLVTHLLLEKSVMASLLWNEISLMLVGVGIALLLNLYMPSIEGKIKEDQSYIEEKMKEILLHMAMALKEHYVSIKEEELFSSLENHLLQARSRAYKNLNNYFFADESYYAQYMEMRMQQFETMKRMRQHFQRFFMTYEQTVMIAHFTEKVAHSIYEGNTAENLLEDLYHLREHFRAMELPVTREEFENRAMLFQFLNDMQQFLEAKYEFKQNYLQNQSSY